MTQIARVVQLEKVESFYQPDYMIPRYNITLMGGEELKELVGGDYIDSKGKKYRNLQVDDHGYFLDIVES